MKFKVKWIGANEEGVRSFETHTTANEYIDELTNDEFVDEVATVSVELDYVRVFALVNDDNTRSMFLAVVTRKEV